MVTTACAFEAQEALEGECMTLGAEAFARALRSAEENHEASRVGGYRLLLARGISDVKAGLDALVEQSKRQPGRKHIAIRWLDAVGTDTAAYMALKVTLDSIAVRTTVQRAARDIAGLILDELRYRRLREEAPALFKYKLEGFTTSHYGHMKRSMDATLLHATTKDGKQVDVSDLDMPPSQKILLGTKLLDVVAATTGLIELESNVTVEKKFGRKARLRGGLYLRATEATKEWLALRNAKIADLARLHYPMCVPPLRWAPGQRGGFRYHLRGHHGLVRQRGKDNERHPAEAANTPLVFETLNALQETPWRINRAVMHLVQETLHEGVSVAGLASEEALPLPPRPENIAEDREVRREWRRKASSVRERNRLRAVRVVEQSNLLRVAERMVQYPAIYFPFNLDFRGRVYSICSYLNPQGDDLSKALLTFAEGKPLGESGAAWLAIHGANCMGETPEGEKVSKMTLDERVQWIVAHETHLREVVHNPLGFSWWHAAEEPLQFYAFAVEWVAALDERKRTGEWSYNCSLPCGMDGSCNGLQHFSAMLRDPIGGRAVNLTLNSRPQDVYLEIAETVLAKLQHLAAHGTDEEQTFALLWLKSGLVNRKLCKRPTMTFSYGSKRWGFREQLINDLQHRDEWADTIKPLFEDGKLLPAACGLLSGLIWDSLREVVVAAYYAMEWLQASAARIAKLNKHVSWTVPVTGFEVRQEYSRMLKTQVKTILAGSIVQPSVFTPSNEVLPHKQANAVAPNIVHSLDAAALMLTVCRASLAGVGSFGMIHDSYSTVPADCETLARITREAFVSLYEENDVVKHFADGLRSQMAEDEADVPVVPSKGSLDLSEVLGSKYFFA